MNEVYPSCGSYANRVFFDFVKTYSIYSVIHLDENHSFMVSNPRFGHSTPASSYRRLLIPFFALWTLSATAQNPKDGNKPAAGNVNAETLQCENQQNPIGIDRTHPRLSWILKAGTDDRGQYQTAFQIEVASSEKLLLTGKPDLWNSGKIDTSLSNNVLYNGKQLRSEMQCFWRVKVWDKNHRESQWSRIALWEMALLYSSDWKGSWIEDASDRSLVAANLYHDMPAPIFRREFKTSKKIKKAVLFVAGLGYYEAYLNGKRVGNRMLEPGWTDYSQRILYSTYDVTTDIKTGSNCFGISLGNGWYNSLPLKMWGRINIRESLTVGKPKFITQLNIEFTDGQKKQIVSDERWQSNDGPIRQNSIYLGETYDATKEIAGWNKPGLQSNGWQQVKLATPPAGNLRSEQQPPIVVRDTLTPVSVTTNATGTYIVDFGRNFAGVIRISLDGKPGTVVRVRYGELLYPDGSLNVMTSTAGQIKQKGTGGPGSPDTAYAKDIFILNGKGRKNFQPHFTFHGFRFIEVTGYAGHLKKDDLLGLALCSNVREAGEFICSDPLINKIQNICLNTFTSNLFSVQSDCPHREKFGYGGDIVATCDAFMMNFDMARFYEKTVSDFADEVTPGGGMTETAPFVGISSEGLGEKSGPVEWGSALPVLLSKLYQYNGNVELIRQDYSFAKNWVEFIRSHARENIITTTIGDHESLDPQQVDLSATAFYYYNTLILARFATLLGKQEDDIRYSALADTIKKAFIGRFVDTLNGKIGIHTESAQAYSLYFGLVPGNSFDRTLDVLLKNISDSNFHITSGIFGTNFLFEVLGQTANSNVACKMVTQTTFPGWGYMLAKGATTLWEHWAFSDNTYSHNHPMFGSVSSWFYRYLAGIRPSEKAVGFDKIIIQPAIENLRWAKARYNSVLGKISSAWKKTGSTFTMDITIPVNATATVLLPSYLKNIRETGTPKRDTKTVVPILLKNHLSEMHLGSGSYHFIANLPLDYH